MGGLFFVMSYVLLVPQRQVRLISSIWDDFVFLDPALFLDSWIVVIFSILGVVPSVGDPFCLKLLFQGP